LILEGLIVMFTPPVLTEEQYNRLLAADRHARELEAIILEERAEYEHRLEVERERSSSLQAELKQVHEDMDVLQVHIDEKNRLLANGGVDISQLAEKDRVIENLTLENKTIQTQLDDTIKASIELSTEYQAKRQEFVQISADSDCEILRLRDDIKKLNAKLELVRDRLDKKSGVVEAQRNYKEILELENRNLREKIEYLELHVARLKYDSRESYDYIKYTRYDY
jgi:soluble cytochrome b562